MAQVRAGLDRRARLDRGGFIEAGLAAGVPEGSASSEVVEETAADSALPQSHLRGRLRHTTPSPTDPH